MAMKPVCFFHGVMICNDLKNVSNNPERAIVPARVAYNGQYKDKQGTVVKTTSFFDLVFYGRNAEIVLQFASKGTPLDAQCEPIENKYESKDGEKRSKTNFKVDAFTLLHKRPAAKDNKGARARDPQDPDFQQSEQDFTEFDDGAPF
jgi:single stranded DNA-binding protein